MKNQEKIQSIIDQQIQKLLELSEKSKMPLSPADINSLTALSKVVAEGEGLERKEKNKMDTLSDEELLLIHKHRQKSKT